MQPEKLQWLLTLLNDHLLYKVFHRKTASMKHWKCHTHLIYTYCFGCISLNNPATMSYHSHSLHLKNILCYQSSLARRWFKFWMTIEKVICGYNAPPKKAEIVKSLSLLVSTPLERVPTALLFVLFQPFDFLKQMRKVSSETQVFRGAVAERGHSTMRETGNVMTQKERRPRGMA